MKRTRITLLLIILCTFATLFAFSILDNTKPFVLRSTTTIATDTQTSVFSMKGYERAHIIGTVTGSATTTELVVIALRRETATASLTDTPFNAVAVTVDDGYFELEVIKSISKPYVSLLLMPDATCTVTIIGVYYGADSSPF